MVLRSEVGIWGFMGVVILAFSLLGSAKQTAAQANLEKKGAENTFTNSFGMEFRLIPAGRFIMGSPSNEPDRLDNEGPQKVVEIAKPFYMGKYEVKVGEFRQFGKDRGYKTDAETKGNAFIRKEGKMVRQEGLYWDNPGFNQTDQHPVTTVSWNDAVEFCRWLSKKTGHSYRLPTEAEWEYACRAGSQTARYFGDDSKEMCKYGNVADRSNKRQFPQRTIHECEDGHVYTAPAGSFLPNAFGLHDMLGNVMEWCSDQYDGAEEFYRKYYGTSGLADPGEPYRVVRGGSYVHAPRGSRCAYRGPDPASFRFGVIGFRIVRTVD